VWLLFRPVRAADGGSGEQEAGDGEDKPAGVLSRANLARATVAGLIFWIGAAAALAPVTIRNWKAAGRFVPVTAHGGINFYIGNNPGADGWYKTPPGFEPTQEGLVRSGRLLAEAETGESLDDAEAAAYWFMKGGDYLLENPGAGLALLARKLYLFWHAYEKPLEGNMDYLASFSPLLSGLPLGFGAVAPLALLGVLLMIRRWHTGAGLLTLFVLVYMATLVLFFVTSRYRLVAVPFLLLHGAHAAWWCLDRLRRREWKPLGAGAAVVVIAAVLGNSFLLGVEDRGAMDLAYTYYNAGNILSRKGETEAAVTSFKHAVELNPEVERFYHGWGNALGKLGRHVEAVSVFEACCRRWSGSARAQYALGYACHTLAGKDAARSAELLGRAEEAYSASLEIDPRQPSVCLNLAMIYDATGRKEEANEMRRRASDLNRKAATEDSR
jgi:tetratricopeptide (TPR) repeat protein